jgi:hypothetical protein
MAKKSAKEEKCSCKSYSCSATGGSVYGLGFIGAAVYYISQATGFWVGVLGFLKALVWPAFLVYEVLKYVSA